MALKPTPGTHPGIYLTDAALVDDLNVWAGYIRTGSTSTRKAPGSDATMNPFMTSSAIFTKGSFSGSTLYP